MYLIPSVVDLVRQRALQLLGDNLLDALGDHRVLAVVQGVSLHVGAGAGVVDLFTVRCLIIKSKVGEDVPC